MRREKIKINQTITSIIQKDRIYCVLSSTCKRGHISYFPMGNKSGHISSFPMGNKRQRI